MPSSLSEVELETILDRLPQLHIGLVGDLFLDRYFEIDPSRCEQSIETGLEAYQVESVRNQPGALGTVMNNLAALGVGRLLPVTVIGADGLGFDLLQALSDLPIDTQTIVQTHDRLTPTYLKPLLCDSSGHLQELNRLDIRTRAPLSGSLRHQLAEQLQKTFTQVDGWIVLDQIDAANEGVIHSEIRAVLKTLADTFPERPMLVDSRSQLHRFSCGSLKGNRSEFLSAANCDDIEQAATELARRTGRPAYATCGDQGLIVAHVDRPAEHAAAYHVSRPIDIVGAGDSATAALLSALLAGVSPLAAASFANIVASITIEQCGTTGTASPAQVRTRWREWSC